MGSDNGKANHHSDNGARPRSARAASRPAGGDMDVDLDRYKSAKVDRLAEEHDAQLEGLQARATSKAAPELPAAFAQLDDKAASIGKSARAAGGARGKDGAAASPDGDDDDAGVGRLAREGSSALGRYLGYTHLGLLFVVVFGGGVGAGYWADGEFGVAPYGTLVGSLVGLVASMYILYREIARHERL